MLDKLSSGDVGWRYGAAIRLGLWVGEPPVRNALIDALKTDPSPFVRSGAAHALGDSHYTRYGDEEAKQSILDALRCAALSDESVSVRAAAQQELFYLRDPPGADPDDRCAGPNRLSSAPATRDAMRSPATTRASSPTSEVLNAHSVLFSQDGREYAHPTSRLLIRLKKATDSEKRILLRQIARVLREGKGYSRLVAARTLLSFFDDEPNQRYLCGEVAKALAYNALRISDAIGGIAIIGGNGDEERALERPILPRQGVYVEGNWIALGRLPGFPGLPRGWRGRDSEAVVDGRIVPLRKGEYPDESIIEWVDWQKVIPKEAFQGDHVIVLRLTVVAPNGTKVRLEHSIQVAFVAPENIKKYIDARNR